MRKKIVGIFVCMLLIATALPAIGATIKNENAQNIDDRGGLFRQYPSPYDDSIPEGYISDLHEGWHLYDDFQDVSSPICKIQWWGQAAVWLFETWYPGDPEGMIFDIIFYEDENGKPGAEFCSYTNISPLIVETGIIYDYGDKWPEPFELYYFEADLSPCCNLSNGWVSILKTYSPDDHMFGWFESPDGNDKMYHNTVPVFNLDVAFILTDAEPDVELKVKSGLGATVKVTNIGTESLTNVPVDIIIYGAIIGDVKYVRNNISSLNADETVSVGTGIFLGLGKIAIGVIVDDQVQYKTGLQLLIFTLISK